jgi:hypothetical protein
MTDHAVLIFIIAILAVAFCAAVASACNWCRQYQIEKDSYRVRIEQNTRLMQRIDELEVEVERAELRAELASAVVGGMWPFPRDTKTIGKAIDDDTARKILDVLREALKEQGSR